MGAGSSVNPPAQSPANSEGGQEAPSGAPTIVALDDVSFNRPVSIGDVLALTAKVVYTGANESELGTQDAASTPSLEAVFQVCTVRVRV